MLKLHEQSRKIQYNLVKGSAELRTELVSYDRLL